VSKTILYLTELMHRELVIKRLEAELKSFDVPQDTYFDIQLAIIEAINNAFVHGCKNVMAPRVVVEWWFTDNSIQIKVKDNGLGFNHSELDLTCEENLLVEEGRGIFLINQVLDKVWFNGKGNEIYGLKKW